jgi:copper homeostasis protein
VAAGADRLELCRDLWNGGLTPHRPILTDLKTHISVPIVAMVRSRPGSFVLEAHEASDLLQQIAAFKDAQVGGVVLGVLDGGGRVDGVALSAMVQVATPLPVTFHRAFDAVHDPFDALETLIEAGVRRVLTGGGPGRAIDGVPRLAELVSQADGRITVMAGGQVRGEHAVELVERTGVRELHARGIAISGITEALRRG